MATSKTLTPTNVTIQIPEFTDQPDQRVNSNCIDKEADAINALNTHIESLETISDVSVAFSQKITAHQYFKIKKCGKMIVCQGYVTIGTALSANEELITLSGVSFANITGHGYFGVMMKGGNTAYTIVLRQDGKIKMDVSASPTGDVAIILVAFCD